jgi:hypothetical protein
MSSQKIDEGGMKYEHETDVEYIEFSNGVISCGNYSYQIDSWGWSELDKAETYKLYLAMHEFFESQGEDGEE